MRKKNTIRMKIKRIYACWIYVSDLQRSQEFYRNIGFDIKVVDGDWIEFALGETSFAILKRPESKGEVVASKTRIMFEVEDIELARDELKSKNVKIIGNIREVPYGRYSFRTDGRRFLGMLATLLCRKAGTFARSLS